MGTVKVQTIQNSFLSGVLDPRSGGRVETDAYREGMKVGNNIVIHHIGGARRRDGTEFLFTLPNTLTRRTGMTIAVPEGDSDTNPAFLNDDDQSTFVTAFAIGTTTDFVVAHYDLGSAIAIRFADVLGIRLSEGTSDDFRIEFSTDDVSWSPLGDDFAVVDAAVERDYRRSPVNDAPVTARYWRVIRAGSDDLGSADVAVAEFHLYTESSTLSNVRLIPFEISVEDKYLLVVTDQSGIIFKDAVFVQYIALPFLSVDIPDIDAANLAETLALVHEDYAPRFVIREFTLENFQTEIVPFDNIPQFDFGDDASPAEVAEIQVSTFSGGWVKGDTYQVELDQARSGIVAYAGDATSDERATTALNLQKAVQGLFSVPGFRGVVVTRTGTLEYTTTFGDGSADTYDGLLTFVPITDAANSVTTTRAQPGEPRAEDAWSEIRGWPRTVTFFENRMYFGGSRSLQQSIFGSSVNNILDFQPLEGLDDEPVFTTLSTAKLNAIQGLYAGRTLQLFTSGGEFRYLKEVGTPILPTDAPLPQTEYGSARIQPVSIDGSTIFIHRTRKAVRDFRFDFEQNAYDSLGLSSLAPHLINGVVDVAVWNGSEFDEIGLVFVVNADGTLAVYNSRKEAKIQAWMSWDTQGEYKSVGVVEEDIYFAVARVIDGTDRLFLEIQNQDCFTDCAVIQTQAPSNTVFGLEHLEGEEVRVKADGFVLHNRTVASGQIMTEQNVTDVEVGLDFNPTITPMPLSAVMPNGNPTIMQKQRIVEVRIKVRNTAGLLMNGKPLPDRYFDIDNFDSVSQTYTGNIKIEETSNWDQSDEKTITLTQVDPLPMEILMIQTTLASEV